MPLYRVLVSVILVFVTTNLSVLVLLAYERGVPPEVFRPLEKGSVLLTICLVTLLCSLIVNIALLLSSTLVSLFASDKFKCKVKKYWSWLLLSILSLSCISASQYYSFFGGYPTAEVVSEFLANPFTSSGYASSAIDTYDYLVLLIAFVCYSILNFFVVKIHLQIGSIKNSTVVLIVLSVVVAYIAQAKLNKDQDMIRMSIASQHVSLPIKLVSDLLVDNSANNIETAYEFRPSFNRNALPLIDETPPHVLLFIIDCARADRLPFYGYQRNTMPLLYEQAKDWIAFKSFYSHGPTTSVSIPVFLNSNYQAGIHRHGMNASFFWDSLKRTGYKTAYINSATLKWGYIEAVAGVNQLDFYFTADHDQKNRIQVSDTAYDFNIRDALLIEKYKTFLDQDSKAKSVAFVHLNAAHYPYHAEPGFIKFNPTVADSELNLGKGFGSVDSSTERVSNSYDNSLLYIDYLINQYIDLLEQRKQLENTVIMIVSDHGEAFREHGLLFHNTGLYNELIHIPLLVRVGKSFPELGKRFYEQQDNIGGLVDIIPTIASLVKAEMSSKYDGRSILYDSPKAYEIMYYRFLVNEFAVINAQRKFAYNLNTRSAFFWNLSKDYKEQRSMWVRPVKDFLSFLEVLEKQQIVTKH